LTGPDRLSKDYDKFVRFIAVSKVYTLSNGHRVVLRRGTVIVQEVPLNADTRFINPENMFVPPGYTQVVETTGPGRIVYIAGQMGIDKDGRLPGDFRAQAVQTFENIRSALAAVGGTMDDIVKLNNYLLDIAYLPIIRDVRVAYVKSDNPPASTTLQVSGFALVGALLEVEAVAMLPAKATRAKSSNSAARTAKAKSSSARAKTAKAKSSPAKPKPAARKPAKKPAARKRR
jgi:enamine deaminase RidA (YjgF/YER057c/UK114 family)